MSEQGVVTSKVTVGLDLDLSQQLTEIATGFLSLYQGPKFIACVILTFLAAQFVHVLMRALFPKIRRVWIALSVWTTHIVVGVVTAHNLLDHMPDQEFYKVFTGANSIVLYYLLLWVATKWFKWPGVARWLSLRETKVTIVDTKPQIEFGDTITFISGKPPRK